MKIINLFLLLSSIAWGQTQCPVNGISTNPADPKPAASGHKTNTFNWMNPDNTATYFWYKNPLSIPNANGEVFSPFFSSQPELASIANDANSDFKPQDGWELIKKDFGYLNNGTVTATKNSIAYFLLYNKFSGKLRVFFSPQDATTLSQKIIVKLSFGDPTPSSTFKYSALFNHYTPHYSLPLSELTNVKSIEGSSNLASTSNFGYVDFQMGYDPCTCFYPSKLIIDFFQSYTANVQLYGRSLGVSEPITNSNSFDTNKDFLTSVYSTPIDNLNSSVNAGMLIYKRTDDLKGDYLQKLEEFKQKNGDLDKLDQFSKGIKAVGSILSIIPVVEVVGKVFEAIGSTTEFVSSTIEKPETPVMPMVIHSEMALTGTIGSRYILPTSNIQLGNPGSQNSNTYPEVPSGISPAYPVYNEVLGTFALLNKPTVNYYQSTVLQAPVSNNYAPRQVQLTNASIQKHTLQLDLSTLKFAFNPALNIDEDKTEIYYALVSEFNYVSSYADFYLTYGMNFNKLYDIRQQGNILTYKTKYISDFQPIECGGTSVLFNVATRVLLNIDGTGYPVLKNNLFTSDNVFLRIMIKSKTKPNPNYSNHVNEALQVFTYPVIINNSTNDPMPNILPAQNRVQNFNNQCDYIILGSQDGKGENWANFVNLNAASNCGGIKNYYFFAPVTISGNLNTLQGTKAEIYSTGNIHLYSPTGRVEMNPETSLNPQFGIDLSTNNGCTSKKYSVNKEGNYDFQSFCSDANKYKSKASTSRIEETASVDKLQVNAVPQHSLSAHPNPLWSSTTFSYKVPEKGSLKLYITNGMGIKVAEVLSNPAHEAGEFQYEYTNSTLPSGIYLVVLEAEGVKETIRLAVVR